MPTVVPLYKRKQRRSAAAGVSSPTPASTSYSTATCSPVPSHFHGAGRPHDPRSGACSPLSQTGSSATGSNRQPTDPCLLCCKSIRYFPERLTCGHSYHSDCYWRWIRVRSNLPEEKSICPRCGFLPSPPASPTSPTSPFADIMHGVSPKDGRRQRKYSSSSDSSLSSSSGSSTFSSSDSVSDVFFL